MDSMQGAVSLGLGRGVWRWGFGCCEGGMGKGRGCLGIFGVSQEGVNSWGLVSY